MTGGQYIIFPGSDTHNLQLVRVRIMIIRIKHLFTRFGELFMFMPHLGFVLLFVNNPLKSAIFYRQILGIEPIEESPTFAGFNLSNGVLLGLWSRHTAEPRVDTQAGAQEICFPVDDVDALYESWGKMQVTIAQKPTDLDFGRTFVICDPDGHRIRVYKLRKEN
jgi:catechol 2,3-dioxygenase-like lactoylglutathione lyase family enzyme